MEREIDLGTLARGEQGELRVFMFEDGRKKLNLPQCQVEINVVMPGTATPILAFSSARDEVEIIQNVATATLTPAQTEELQPGRYVVEVIVEDPVLGDRQRAMKGTLQIEESSA